MYLSKLEIIGFKSFAQKTVFRFNEGLTAIVGPNGCGKTNVVDAIRWVLGEQKTSVLRSDVMENVIFNGTSTRKPLGMAEVSLTIENTNNILPSEFSEVTVTRRLFRDGESNYLINNTICRLKDIQDLFMDTGMGSDSYSVIELKMIEAILSGKYEDRRHLIEEAAGVTKYKLRRKEAAKKLLFIQNDLQRVNDIVSEIEKQVNSLARQAAKTKRYNKLQSELKELELKLFFYEFIKEKKELASLQEKMADFQKVKQQKDEIITESENNLKELEAKFFKLDENFQNSINAENLINNKINSISKELAVNEQKIKNLIETQEKIRLEIKNSEKLIETNTALISDNNKKIESLKKEFFALQETVSSSKIELDDSLKNLKNQRDDNNILYEKIIKLESEIQINNQSILKNKKRISEIQKLIEQLEKEQLEISNSISESEKSLEKFNKNRTELSNRVDEVKQTLEKSLREQSEIDSKISKIQEEISETRVNLNSNITNLEFLEGIEESDESTKFLLKSDDWKVKGGKFTLAEIISTDDKFRIALESALGSYSNCLIVENKSELDKAIQILKSKNLSKVPFICKELIPETDGFKNLKKTSKIFGWVSDLIKNDGKIKNLIRLLVGKTAIVEDYETAHELIHSGTIDTGVTLEGELISKFGYFKVGTPAKTEGLKLGKLERIQALNKEIKENQNKIEKLSQQLSELKQKREEIDIQEINNKLRTADNELSECDRQISLTQYKKDSLAKTLTANQERILKLKDELGLITEETSNFEQLSEEYQNELQNSLEEFENKKQDLDIIETQFTEQQTRFKEMEMNLIRLESEIKSIEGKRENLKKQIETEEEKIIRLKNDLISNDKLIEELKKESEDLELKKSQLSTELEDAELKKKLILEEKNSIEEQIERYSSDLSKLRKEHEKSLEAYHRLDLEINEKSNLIKSILSMAQDKYDTDLNSVQIDLDENFSIANVKENVNDIRYKLKELGSVNFVALEEYEAQSKRLEFYEKQVKDLVESEKTLQETIEEINTTAEAKFLDTFNKVNIHFKDLFKTLFSQDAEAELRLLEPENPLESEIEIFARPAGKKPHSIEMLSGGEKTLTAIALLFSIYLVKPSPFCILDEIDAPLDDTNIDKFLNLIKQFSKNTQFFIVTHNKKTMEACDTLYGITMQEEGVSKVVSVRFVEA
ncbi:MAG: chromosome segregation protein SMC [Candidatus Kapabacteria bacterium]|nr:chromosome segregation protein SMC [Candidatus Kapabacteria bacterium]